MTNRQAYFDAQRRRLDWIEAHPDMPSCAHDYCGSRDEFDAAVLRLMRNAGGAEITQSVAHGYLKIALSFGENVEYSVNITLDTIVPRPKAPPVPDIILWAREELAKEEANAHRAWVDNVAAMAVPDKPQGANA